MLKEILARFDIAEDISPYGNGHINDTYFAELNGGFILQKINKSVFQNPEMVMENIAAITDFMKAAVEKEGGDPKRETLSLIKTIDGKNFYKASDGEYYRCYLFIRDTVTIEKPKTTEIFKNAGCGFGGFARLLRDFDINTLHETIEDFHNTEKRYADFIAAFDSDCCGRAAEAADLCRFARQRRAYAPVVTGLIKSGEIPLRVTHNDTKLNNILFDKDSFKPVCVIDLDTVMPGSLLYDFGDAVRYGANRGLEDDRELDRVGLDIKMYQAFKEGYLSKTADFITPRELQLLEFSCVLMTYECGLRFLTDYLNNDVYFKVHRPRHNLERAAAQFRLVEDMEARFFISPSDF